MLIPEVRLQEFALLPTEAGVASYRIDGDRTVLVAPLEPAVHLPSVRARTSVSGRRAAVVVDDNLHVYDLNTGQREMTRRLSLHPGEVFLRGDVVVLVGSRAVVIESLANESQRLWLEPNGHIAAARLCGPYIEVRYQRHRGSSAGTCTGPTELPPALPASASLFLASDHLMDTWTNHPEAVLRLDDGELARDGFRGFDCNDEIRATLHARERRSNWMPDTTELRVVDIASGECLVRQEWEEHRPPIEQLQGATPRPPARSSLQPHDVAVVGRSLFLDDQSGVYGGLADKLDANLAPVPPEILAKLDALKAQEKRKTSFLKRLFGKRKSEPKVSLGEMVQEARASKLSREDRRWKKIDVPPGYRVYDVVTVEQPQRAYLLLSSAEPDAGVAWIRVSTTDFAVLEHHLP